MQCPNIKTITKEIILKFFLDYNATAICIQFLITYHLEVLANQVVDEPMNEF